MFYFQPLAPRRGEEEGGGGMNMICCLVWKALSVYGWFITVSLLWEEVELKIWGSNDEFDVDNRGSRGNSAGRDSNIDHWSLIELEQTNNSDSIYQAGGGGSMWYIVAGIVAMVFLVCFCKKTGAWKSLDCSLCGGNSTEERANSSRERRRRREDEEEEREGRRALREVELKRMIQAASAPPPAPPPPQPPPPPYAPQPPPPPQAYAQPPPPPQAYYQPYGFPNHQPPQAQYFGPQMPTQERGACACDQSACPRCGMKDGSSGRDNSIRNTLNVTVKGNTVTADAPDKMSDLDPDDF